MCAGFRKPPALSSNFGIFENEALQALNFASFYAAFVSD
jgi:hypothetical protein